MINIKALLMAAAVSVGVVFAMPAASQAMPASAPVKIQVAKGTNIVEAKHKKRWKRHEKWRESRRWRHRNHFARYCDPWEGCYRRRHSRFYRYWDEPYYGDYPYYYGGYPYHGGGGYGPGLGLYFRF